MRPHVPLLLLLHVVFTPPTNGDDFVFGSGCFWGRQHSFVQLEEQQWQRTPSEITTIGIYFGGNSPNNTLACYYNAHDQYVYSEEGHAEAVVLDIPTLDHLPAALAVYWQSFDNASGTFMREDYFDVGPGYRALLGFQGGVHNKTIMNVLNTNNPHNATFREALGSDADTLGLNFIWIYDTSTVSKASKLSYPYHQTELCLQFHNNQTGKYSKDYHALKSILLQQGRLKDTDCPMPEIDSCL